MFIFKQLGFFCLISSSVKLVYGFVCLPLCIVVNLKKQDENHDVACYLLTHTAAVEKPQWASMKCKLMLQQLLQSKRERE